MPCLYLSFFLLLYKKLPWKSEPGKAGIYCIMFLIDQKDLGVVFYFVLLTYPKEREGIKAAVRLAFSLLAC